MNKADMKKPSSGQIRERPDLEGRSPRRPICRRNMSARPAWGMNHLGKKQAEAVTGSLGLGDEVSTAPAALPAQDLEPDDTDRPGHLPLVRDRGCLRRRPSRS